MSVTKILNEAQHLSSVSDRLGSLADQNPVVSEALLAIAGNIRESAVLLEVLVATRIEPASELQ
ncbi:MAG: hypothetical protein LAO56_23070 [Acidobacteriia bacterium]|jgi:hypothetical protein|nr:hypothetical protein [Terriglobia bacterium]